VSSRRQPSAAGTARGQLSGKLNVGSDLAGQQVENIAGSMLADQLETDRAARLLPSDWRHLRACLLTVVFLFLSNLLSDMEDL
jgi:hypothetical protein